MMQAGVTDVDTEAGAFAVGEAVVVSERGPTKITMPTTTGTVFVGTSAPPAKKVSGVALLAAFALAGLMLGAALLVSAGPDASSGASSPSRAPASASSTTHSDTATTGDGLARGSAAELEPTAATTEEEVIPSTATPSTEGMPTPATIRTGVSDGWCSNWEHPSSADHGSQTVGVPACPVHTPALYLEPQSGLAGTHLVPRPAFLRDP